MTMGIILLEEQLESMGHFEVDPGGLPIG